MVSIRVVAYLAFAQGCLAQHRGENGRSVAERETSKSTDMFCARGVLLQHLTADEAIVQDAPSMRNSVGLAEG